MDSSFSSSLTVREARWRELRRKVDDAVTPQVVGGLHMRVDVRGNRSVAHPDGEPGRVFGGTGKSLLDMVFPTQSETQPRVSRMNPGLHFGRTAICHSLASSAVGSHLPAEPAPILLPGNHLVSAVTKPPAAPQVCGGPLQVTAPKGIGDWALGLDCHLMRPLKHSSDFWSQLTGTAVELAKKWIRKLFYCAEGQQARCKCGQTMDLRSPSERGLALGVHGTSWKRRAKMPRTATASISPNDPRPNGFSGSIANSNV